MDIDAGDTAWLLSATAMAFATTAGFAIFYAGMARKKNALGSLMHGFASLCGGGIVWALWGGALAFSADKGGVIGGWEWVYALSPGAHNLIEGRTVPRMAIVLFGGMGAALSLTIISGSFAERMRFSAFLLFAMLWLTFVYVPLSHWVLGKGWISEVLGALDFAGGAVIHVSAGVTAVTASLIVGKRAGYGSEPMPPHSRALAAIGAGLIWFGWLGMNAGHAYAADGMAVRALVNTQVSASSGFIGWLVLERTVRGKVTLLGALSGAVAGLVAVTPACGHVNPSAAIIIGAVAGLAAFVAVMLKPRLGYDDTFDVFGIHGVSGTWGILATGLFASRAINPLGADGVFSGHPPLLGVQALMLVAVYLFVAFDTIVILKIVDWVVGLRVDEEEEALGLDLSQHGESAYHM